MAAVTIQPREEHRRRLLRDADSTLPREEVTLDFVKPLMAVFAARLHLLGARDGVMENLLVAGLAIDFSLGDMIIVNQLDVVEFFDLPQFCVTGIAAFFLDGA